MENKDDTKLPTRNIQDGRGKGKARGRANQQNSCHNCERYHSTQIWLAFGKKCLYCNNLNHFEKICRGKNVSKGIDIMH